MRTQKQRGQKTKWFGFGLIVGMTMLSMALGSVPRTGRVTDDTAIYDNLSEIRVRKQAKIDFDQDISRLSALEERYQERLPRLRGPIQRIQQQKYRAAAQRPARKPRAMRN